MSVLLPLWPCQIINGNLCSVRREENQLDATERFIALIICSTCFGHLYSHHQKLETILVLLPLMVCNAGYASGMREAARAGFLHPGRLSCCPVPDRRPPSTKALHTICGNNDDGNMSAINHSVASSWVSSLRID